MSYNPYKHFEREYPDQIQKAKDKLLDYVVETYGAVWNSKVTELLEDDAYNYFHQPVFNYEEEFIYHSDAYDFIILGCNNAYEGARKMLETVEWLDFFDEEVFGEVQWSRTRQDGSVHGPTTIAGLLWYWIGYHYAVPHLETLNKDIHLVGYSDEVRASKGPFTA